MPGQRPILPAEPGSDIGAPDSGQQHGDIWFSGSLRDSLGNVVTLAELVKSKEATAPTAAIFGRGKALGTIPGHRAVTLAANGKLFLASASNVDLAGVAGITTDAYDIGQTVSYVSAGKVENPGGWSWTPGPVFLGQSGKLTQVVPSTGWLYIVGLAVSPSALLVRPASSPIRMG